MFDLTLHFFSDLSRQLQTAVFRLIYLSLFLLNFALQSLDLLFLVFEYFWHPLRLFVKHFQIQISVINSHCTQLACAAG